MIFETERLLRLIKQDDAQGIVGYASEPNVGFKQRDLTRRWKSWKRFC